MKTVNSYLEYEKKATEEVVRLAIDLNIKHPEFMGNIDILDQIYKRSFTWWKDQALLGDEEPAKPIDVYTGTKPFKSSAPFGD